MFEREAEPKWNNGSILFILSKKNKFVKNQNIRNFNVRFIVRIYIVEQIVEQIFHVTAISPISFSQRKYFLCLW